MVFMFFITYCLGFWWAVFCKQLQLIGKQDLLSINKIVIFTCVRVCVLYVFKCVILCLVCCVVAPGKGAGVHGTAEERRTVDRQHQHVRSMGNQVR